MKFPKKTVIAVVLVGGLFVAARFVLPKLAGSRGPQYRHAEVSRGDVVEVVNSTGAIKPVLSVSVGAFVSGPIVKLHVDFNDEVVKDQLLAVIDKRLYKAAVARDKAQLAIRDAEVIHSKALRDQAVNAEIRAKNLSKINEAFISAAEMDQFTFSKQSLDAQWVVAKASQVQAHANLKNSETNLEYTNILAPVSGIVIDRKINEGQTLASQFQTPELFVIAPEMRDEMYIDASVDEADIGLIRSAEKQKLPVSFTVDAYPDDLFTGYIHQVRYSSKTEQNVVTYSVVVTTLHPDIKKITPILDMLYPELPLRMALRSNPELKLLPGMTANLSFQVGEAKNVLRIPNTALRFFPKRERVRPQDRKILDGVAFKTNEDEENDAVKLTAKQKAKLRKNRSRRHVWVEDGEFLKAVAVVTGLSDNQFTQLVSGDLKLDQKLVTGIQSAR